MLLRGETRESFYFSFFHSVHQDNQREKTIICVEQQSMFGGQGKKNNKVATLFLVQSFKREYHKSWNSSCLRKRMMIYKVID